MVIKESKLVFDSPLVKIMSGNKKLTLADIQSERVDFEYWLSIMNKLNYSQSEIKKMFSKIKHADDLAKAIYDKSGKSDSYKKLFAE